MNKLEPSIQPPSLLEATVPFRDLLHHRPEFDEPHISGVEIGIVRSLNNVLMDLGHISRVHRLITVRGIFYPNTPPVDEEVEAEILNETSTLLLAELQQASLLKLRLPEPSVPEDAFWSLGFVFQTVGDLRSLDTAESLVEEHHSEELVAFVPLSGIRMIEPVVI